MTRSWISRVKPLAGVLALEMAVTSAAPTFATDAAKDVDTAAARPLSASVAAQISATPVPTAAVTQEPTSEATGDKSFFKSRKGVAALVLMFGGVAYTLYSKDKDRIHSPIR